MNITGLKVIDSEWTATGRESAELTLHLRLPTGEKVRLSFDFDQDQLLRMVQAYQGRHIFGLR